MLRLPLRSAITPVNSGMIAPPEIATFKMPEPSAARSPSPSLARVKMVGNMMEFIRPIASRLQHDTAPRLLAERRSSRMAPQETKASTLPGLNRVNTAEPTKRPISAPPQ